MIDATARRLLRAPQTTMEDLSMAKPRLRIIPLGGVGEIGKSMTVYEYRNDLIVIDAGAKFPEEDLRGVDLIIPDVGYIKQRLNKLRAILLTHGHEDHIGGISFILNEFKSIAPVPIYGSELAIAYARAKLEDYSDPKLADFRVVEPRKRYRLGQHFEVEFIPVTHSIPGSYAIALKTPLGWVVHTGDYKFDPTPPLGPRTDEERLKQLGREGVLVLLSDAVRVERPGHTPSEAVVSETLDRIIGAAEGRVVLTTFASNITRIDQAIRAAHRHGRKVAISGRSMEQSTRIAQELGYLHPPDGVLVPVEIAMTLPRKQAMLLTTGSQGEATAALARIASSDHPHIRLTPGDLVIFSATPIPGNEQTVSETIDQLFRMGIKVIYPDIEPTVHVSGHASREELKHMLRLLRPRFCVPVHGEYRHLALYRELALELGYLPERVVIPELGSVLSFSREDVRREGTVDCGPVLVDFVTPTHAVLRRRDEVASSGVIIAAFVIDRETGKLIAGPEVTAEGLNGKVSAETLAKVTEEFKRFLAKQKGGFSHGYLVSRTKSVLGRQLYRRAKFRPLILPLISEL
jgi:ribonuclease J